MTPESDWHLPFRHKNIKVMKNNRNGHHAYKEALLTTKQPGDLSTLTDGFLLAKPWLSPLQLLHFVELT